jgi:hypothetical protein
MNDIHLISGFIDPKNENNTMLYVEVLLLCRQIVMWRNCSEYLCVGDSLARTTTPQHPSTTFLKPLVFSEGIDKRSFQRFATFLYHPLLHPTILDLFRCWTSLPQ